MARGALPSSELNNLTVALRILKTVSLSKPVSASEVSIEGGTTLEILDMVRTVEERGRRGN